MNDEFNIEGLFKDNAEGYEVTPGNNVWKGISRQMWKRRFGDFFKLSFEGYRVEPSAFVWTNIARRLWFYNFIRFNPASFNVYYLGIALSFIIATIAFNSGNDTVYPAVRSGNNQSLAVLKNIVSGPVPENITTRPVAGNTTEMVSGSANTNSVSPLQNEAPVVREQVKQNFSQNGDKKQKAGKDNLHTNKNTAFNTVFKNQAQVRQAKVLEPVLADATPEHHDTGSLLSPSGKSDMLSMLQPKPGLLMLTATGENMKPDSVIFNVYGTPIVIDKTRWSVDAWASPMINRTGFSAKNPEMINYSDNLGKQVSDAVTYKNYGCDVNFSYKNWIFQLGVSYLEFGQQMHVPATVTELQPKTVYNYAESQLLHTDSARFIDFDHLLEFPGDTVWISEVVKQYWIVHRDSSGTTVYDTLRTTSGNQFLNRYTYFEIPFTTGYEYRRDKFSFIVRGGIAAGFLVRTSGHMARPSGDESYDLEKTGLPYTAPNFSLLFGIGINYHISDKIAIFGEPYVRKNINSVFESNYAVSQKFQSTGIKFGIRYSFK